MLPPLTIPAKNKGKGKKEEEAKPRNKLKRKRKEGDHSEAYKSHHDLSAKNLVQQVM